jgi:hypothetical protein
MRFLAVATGFEKGVVCGCRSLKSGGMAGSAVEVKKVDFRAQLFSSGWVEPRREWSVKIIGPEVAEK